MTSRTAFSVLIERLKKLTGPDRESDGLIFQTIGGDAWRDAVLRASEPSGCPKGMAEREARERFAPRYTASIDAALTLVPEGLGWIISRHDDNGSCWAEINGPSYRGATPAIALCIAALKVRDRQSSTE